MRPLAHYLTASRPVEARLQALGDADHGFQSMSITSSRPCRSETTFGLENAIGLAWSFPELPWVADNLTHRASWLLLERKEGTGCHRSGSPCERSKRCCA